MDDTKIERSIQDTDTSVAFFDFNQDLVPSEKSLSKREIGRSLYQLGKIHYDKSDLDLAELNFEKSLACVELPRDTFSAFKVLGFLIRISSERLEDEKANKYITQSEKLVEDLSQMLGTLNAEFFYNQGVIQNYRGKFDDSLVSFNLSLAKSREENEADLQAKTLLALANNCFSRGQNEESLDYLNQLNELLKVIHKDYLRGAMYMLSARVYMELEDYSNAITFFKKANNNLQIKKCWNLFGYILLGKGMAEKSIGSFDKSLFYFDLALDSTDQKVFKRLYGLIEKEIEETRDSNVDIYLDRSGRKIKEREMGIVDFKHRFVLLEILFLLAKNAGSYYDKEDLARSIWKDEYNPLIHDKLIYTSVSRLRKLIEPKKKEHELEKRKYILRGKDGYTFNPDVKIRFHLESKSSIQKSIGNIELSSPV